MELDQLFAAAKTEGEEAISDGVALMVALVGGGIGIRLGIKWLKRAVSAA